MLDGAHRSLALVGGVESLSHVQIGLIAVALGLAARISCRREGCSEEVRNVSARSRAPRSGCSFPASLIARPAKSMGEHMEMTVRAMGTISRNDQDAWSLESHRNAVAAWERGFFDDLVMPLGGVTRDAIPRADTSLEKLARLAPAFDRRARHDHRREFLAANRRRGGGVGRFGCGSCASARPICRASKLVDWEIASIDLWNEGLLMAPAYAIPRMLARCGSAICRTSRFGKSTRRLRRKCWRTSRCSRIAPSYATASGVDRDFGPFPRDRVNPNGGSIALGHPFGATGARILSQTVKELAQLSARLAGDREHLCRWRRGHGGTLGAVALEHSWRAKRD